MSDITTEIEYLDGTFTVLEPEPASVADLVTLLGEEACRQSVIDDIRYRNKYPRVYKKVSAKLVELGFARAIKETKTLKDGTIRNVLISEMDHLRAFIAPENDADGKNKEMLASLFSEIATAEPLYVKGERVGGQGRISQAAITSANLILANGKEEDAVEKIETLIGKGRVLRDTDGNVTAESLARGIMAWEKQIIANAKKQNTLLG